MQSFALRAPLPPADARFQRSPPYGEPPDHHQQGSQHEGHKPPAGANWGLEGVDVQMPGEGVTRLPNVPSIHSPPLVRSRTSLRSPVRRPGTEGFQCVTFFVLPASVRGLLCIQRNVQLWVGVWLGLLSLTRRRPSSTCALHARCQYYVWIGADSGERFDAWHS